MATFILTGDVIKPARVKVTGVKTLEEALEKAAEGQFQVYDESDRDLAFEFGGDGVDEFPEADDLVDEA